MTSHQHPAYLPGLNGLRAFAAITVLLLHINDALPSLNLPSWGRTQGGLFAVTVFFSLSGFLITYLLIREKASTDTVSIPNFYIRRTLRIWPLYYLFLGVALSFNYLVQQPYDKELIWYALFFASNIPSVWNAFIANTAHIWSLGVEEQFYLMWPWMIKWSRKPIYALGIFLVAFELLKITARFAFGGTHPAYLFFYISRFDCMAIGGIGAWYYWKGIPQGLKTLLYSIPTQVICWLMLAATVPDWFHVFSFADHTLISLASLVLMLNLIDNPKPIFRLEHRVWRYLGGISFGIYMWHPLIMAANALLLPLLPIPAWGKITFLILAVGLQTILIAHFSMKYIESPFLRIKDKFQSAKAPRSGQ